MTRSFIARYVSPWALRKDKKLQQRVAALRQRDGDSCRRCRRPIRFDLPRGHDKGPKVERILPGDTGDELIQNLCLTHGRCNAAGADNTDEVTERIRRKSEAELLSRSQRPAKRRSRKA
ncbi:MAG TPA: hypothetical protein VN713_04490 [Sphingomicrobium sp.]|nr:hypothetical protein [Sphingomicrobium sp.]